VPETSTRTNTTMIRPLRAPPWTTASCRAASGGLHWGGALWRLGNVPDLATKIREK
jgi:hypothetical protein